MRPLTCLPPSHLLSLFLILVVVLLSPSANAALRTPPSSFCKCTCGTNSTIIALNPPASSPSPTSANSNSNLHLSLLARAPSSHKLSCTSCTRSFCASYNLPICKSTAEDDILTSCFQRDNLKDELVIYAFLAATVGLLGWAGIRPWVDKLRGLGTGKADEADRYTPAAGREPEEEQEAESSGARTGGTR